MDSSFGSAQRKSSMVTFSSLHLHMSYSLLLRKDDKEAKVHEQKIPRRRQRDSDREADDQVEAAEWRRSSAVLGSQLLGRTTAELYTGLLETDCNSASHSPTICLPSLFEITHPLMRIWPTQSRLQSKELVLTRQL
jgi:hypothetical protein